MLEKLGDELAIKVAEAHERVYCTNRLRGVLVIDGPKLDRVH